MKVEPFPYSIEITVEAPLYHSEDEEKVRKAIENIFLNVEVTKEAGKPTNLIAVGKGAKTLHIVYQQLRARQVLGVARRLLLEHVTDDSTWLYLNKQAAFVGIVSICEEWGESPLGPIKITIKCQQMKEFIDWLTPST